MLSTIDSKTDWCMLLACEWKQSEGMTYYIERARQQKNCERAAGEWMTFALLAPCFNEWIFYTFYASDLMIFEKKCDFRWISMDNNLCIITKSSLSKTYLMTLKISWFNRAIRCTFTELYCGDLCSTTEPMPSQTKKSENVILWTRHVLSTLYNAIDSINVFKTPYLFVGKAVLFSSYLWRTNRINRRLINMSVVIETTLGDLTVDLFLTERPMACLNFLKLCKLKYYNYNLFHTIEAGFIAQTGGKWNLLFWIFL